jgi:RimJ/RimL family protein N-acetyltransferase
VLAFVARAQRLRARGARETFAVCETGRLVGIAVLARDLAVPDRAEIGYWIGPSYRGRGYATAAARQLIGHAFGRMKLALVLARCPSTNCASVRILDKLGLRLVGSEPWPCRIPAADPVGRYELTHPEWRNRETLQR